MKRALLTSLALVVFIAGLTAAVAFAGNGKHKPHVRHCYIHHVYVCPPPLLTTTIVRTTTGTTTTTPTTTTSETTTTSPTPPLNPNEPVEGFCVQATKAGGGGGETFIQANPGAFDPGGAWYEPWKNQETVVVAGQTITLQYENGKDVIQARNVPGVGLTCDQPWVTTDGVPTVGVNGEPLAIAVAT